MDEKRKCIKCGIKTMFVNEYCDSCHDAIYMPWEINPSRYCKLEHNHHTFYIYSDQRTETKRKRRINKLDETQEDIRKRFGFKE